MRAQMFRTLYIRSRRRLRGFLHYRLFVKLCHGCEAARLSLPDGKWPCRESQLRRLPKMPVEIGYWSDFGTLVWKTFTATKQGISLLSMVEAKNIASR